MPFKDRTRLIAYIDSMYHSCLDGKTLSHKVSECPKRKAVLAVFIQKYENKTWVPAEDLQHIPTQEKEDPNARGQMGAMSYVKDTTTD